MADGRRCEAMCANERTCVMRRGSMAGPEGRLLHYVAWAYCLSLIRNLWVASAERRPLINTPLQRGDGATRQCGTVSTVSRQEQKPLKRFNLFGRRKSTSLKRGVNEKAPSAEGLNNAEKDGFAAHCANKS